jgi:hypothetical protein
MFKYWVFSHTTMSLESIIQREQEKAILFLHKWQTTYFKAITAAITSGAVNTEELNPDDYTFVQVVFNIMGAAESPISGIGKNMKKNLEHFIP